jgi:sugar (pentulose or hexulose) kinase
MIAKTEEFNNRFSVGFSNEQFSWIEEGRLSLINETKKWISRADYVRTLLFGEKIRNDSDDKNKAE